MKLENEKCQKEYGRFKKRLNELIAKCKLKFYIAKEIEYVYEIINYPYRLMTATEFYSMDKNKKPLLIKLNKVKDVIPKKVIQVTHQVKPTVTKNLPKCQFIVKVKMVNII